MQPLPRSLEVRHREHHVIDRVHPHPPSSRTQPSCHLAIPSMDAPGQTRGHDPRDRHRPRRTGRRRPRASAVPRRPRVPDEHGVPARRDAPVHGEGDRHRAGRRARRPARRSAVHHASGDRRRGARTARHRGASGLRTRPVDLPVPLRSDGRPEPARPRARGRSVRRGSARDAPRRHQCRRRLPQRRRPRVRKRRFAVRGAGRGARVRSGAGRDRYRRQDRAADACGGRAAGQPCSGPTTPVWSIGHRNSFGLCVDPATGALWETGERTRRRRRGEPDRTGEELRLAGGHGHLRRQPFRGSRRGVP